MSVTIFYRHAQRPDEAGMTRIPNDEYAAALKDQLEKRGFQIIETVPSPIMIPRSQPAPSPGADD
jgi:hypothetical protein